MNTSEELRRLAMAAATLDERLSELFRSVPASTAEADTASRRLAAWCRSAANGDEVLFAARLRRDELALGDIIPRLAAVEPAPGQALPAWVDDAAWIIPAMLGDEIPNLDTTRAAQPFASLFRGLVAEATRRRDTLVAPGALARVSASVHQDMAHELLTRLTKLCAMALYDEFAARRSCWQGQKGEAQSAAGIGSGKQHYEDFLKQMRESGLRCLFERKPVLLRLLASLTRQWMDATAEFLTRLYADADAVRLTLLGRAVPSRVIMVEAGLSDQHNFGRRVHIVRFADGATVVYKPKDLTIDAAWAELVSWLNTRGAPIDLRAARVVPRCGYGWAEFIDHLDCPDRTAAARFFRRAGALLSLLHIFAGNDMHEENIIAAGEFPIPIDLETLMQASDLEVTSEEPPLRAASLARRKLQHSVLATGLLTGFVRSPETAMLPVGGLNEAQYGKPREIVWREINTDAMSPAIGPTESLRAANLPRIDGEIIRIDDHIDAFLEGCESYFRLVLGLKAELLSAGGPLAAFEASPIRLVLRPTQFYWLLIERLRNHRRMEDGAVWSAQLDFVSRFADWDQDDEPLWPLANAERHALADLNIPFFVQTASDAHIRDGSGTTSVASNRTPGLVVVQRRIAQLDGAEIAWQLYAARVSMLARRSSGRSIGATIPRQIESAAGVETLDRVVALQCAGHIADRLSALAIREGNSAAWIGLDPLADGGGFQLAPLGNDLYGGHPGIALFLAAHARVAGAASSRELALVGLTGIRHILRGRRASHLARVLGIGGAGGIGSLIYAFATIARLLDEAPLLQDAIRASRLLTQDLIASDKTYDVIGGAAGCILGLLKLHRETGDTDVLDRASECGRHLLRNRRDDSSQFNLWRHLSRRPLTGFSHGVAGLAYALSALAQAAGTEAYAAAAKDCIAYEQSLFSPEHGNWPDLREHDADSGTAWPCQWCHGAGGIGLARIGMHRFGNAGFDVIQDIRTAVAMVKRFGRSPIDTLCCGNLGNCELLSEAARVLGEDELAILASRRIREVLAAADVSGSFGWNVGGDRENLGLFRGLAGVGYALTRWLAPDSVDNVLIWQ